MSNKRYNPAYTQAFERYIRFGTPITEPYELDENQIPAIYVWRTKGDSRVRLAHQDNQVITQTNSRTQPASDNTGLQKRSYPKSSAGLAYRTRVPYLLLGEEQQIF